VPSVNRKMKCLHDGLESVEQTEGEYASNELRTMSIDAIMAADTISCLETVAFAGHGHCHLSNH
jgi:hypothetical protein